jgi:hypothetical protein
MIMQELLGLSIIATMLVFMHDTVVIGGSSGCASYIKFILLSIEMELTSVLVIRTIALPPSEQHREGKLRESPLLRREATDSSGGDWSYEGDEEEAYGC